jgi:hypothetical protein
VTTFELVLPKKTHDWVVDQITDISHTTYKLETQQVSRSLGQSCGDIDLTGYLVNVSGPVPLVLDLHITHERFGGCFDPSINGHIHYPNDLDGPLNETTVDYIDNIRQYHTDYNNRHYNTISFMSVITSTSGSLLSEFFSSSLFTNSSGN